MERSKGQSRRWSVQDIGAGYSVYLFHCDTVFVCFIVFLCLFVWWGGGWGVLLLSPGVLLPFLAVLLPFPGVLLPFRGALLPVNRRIALFN